MHRKCRRRNIGATILREFEGGQREAGARPEIYPAKLRIWFREDAPRDNSACITAAVYNFYSGHTFIFVHADAHPREIASPSISRNVNFYFGSRADR